MRQSAVARVHAARRSSRHMTAVEGRSRRDRPATKLLGTWSTPGRNDSPDVGPWSPYNLAIPPEPVRVEADRG